MAEEFVDFYQILDLPVDAEREKVRKRINERYLEAQRNLDHRNFATRVSFQREFEVTLPQARYILLDEGRRADYDRLVNASRGNAVAPAASPTSDAAAPPKFSGFSLEDIAGSAPTIAPLPPVAVDPAQLALEREELWKKWKTGLEAAIQAPEEQPKARAASKPVSAAPDSVLTSPAASASNSTSNSAPKAARPKVDVSFDFTPPQSAAPGQTAGGFEPEIAAPALNASEIEARRTHHRREITKEILVNIGLIWGIAGALMVIVPGTIALIAAVAHYYPRNAKPLLGFPSVRLWLGGAMVIFAAAFFASTELSKAMRRQKAAELSRLSYEELIKQSAKK